MIVNGKLSSPHPVISGVPQGSVLGPLLFLVLIGDIDANILHSDIASFADDTRATKGLESEMDAADLQNDIFRIYEWSVKNNMKFNSLKFELLRYGKNTELKDSTRYVTPEWKLIEDTETVRDLGVTMSNDCTFHQHINNIVESAKIMSSWVLRTFSTRERIPMMTLYKSLVRPLVEYSSALWSPIAKGEIKKLEDVQISFIRKIKGISRDYHTALKELNLSSLERRRERYIIIHIWKMLENLTPNLANTDECSIQTQTDFTHRRGRTCKSQNLNKTPSHLLQAKKQTIKCIGAKLFNNLPKNIRNTTDTSIDVFKSKLDKYLRSKEDFTSLSNAQPSWLETNHLTIVREVTLPNLTPPSTNIEQRPAVFPINPVSGPREVMPASGQTVNRWSTQMS